jgi:hypothetical protein
LENLGDNVDINRAWRGITDNIQISTKECVYYCLFFKAWLDEECSKQPDQKKQAKLQML